MELLLERGATVTIDLTKDGAVQGAAEIQEALRYNNHALALKLLPHLFVASSSEALYQTVVIINHAYRLSHEVLSNDTEYAENLLAMSDEVRPDPNPDPISSPNPNPDPISSPNNIPNPNLNP